MMVTIVILVVLVVALGVFGLAAYRWGVDSRDAFDTQEWARRQQWRW